MKFKFLNELIINASKLDYSIQNDSFESHSQQLIEYLDLHLTIFIVVLLSFFSVLILELINQNKLIIKQKCQTLCFEGAVVLLGVSYSLESN